MRILILKERLKNLNASDVKDRRYVLYWMQSSHRTEYNLALEYAILKANELKKPLIVFFGITRTFPAANFRHYCFMLEGIREVSASLEEKGIKMVLLNSSPETGVAKLSKDACLIVVDKGYLKILKGWYRHVAKNVDCPLVQVEDNVVVPCEEASQKEEYSAATLRPKIIRKRQRFLTRLDANQPRQDSLRLELDSLDLKDVENTISALGIDTSVKRTTYFRGGMSEAMKHLVDFLKNKLEDYPELRNDPTVDYLSGMSPYLHFGQISPVNIALRVLDTDASDTAKEAYLEELIVRRELAINYVHYNEDYDSFIGVPEWAKRTLAAHKNDPHEYLYTLEELENAETHDPYWNAAQNEMRVIGKMHGYMRMYWGKKLIEWSEDHEVAFATALYLNNKYELDGRDPNGFAGVAWCFGKHDRPWKERPIFGKVRFMNENGLRRKFDADKYVERVKHL